MEALGCGSTAAADGTKKETCAFRREIFFFSSCLHMLEREVQALLVRSGVNRGMEEKCQSHPGSSLQQDLVSRAMVGALKPSVFLGVVGWQD